MKLYSYWRSSSSWRVRIALGWKNLPFDYAPIHLLQDGGQQNQDAYRAKNPMRTVPLLELETPEGPRRISQSMAILEFLEETHPEPPLLPKDPFQRATVRQLAEMVNSGIQPLQNLSVMQQVKASGGDDKAWCKYWVARGMTAVETVLQETAGRYCVGDQVTYADLYLIPQLYSCRRFGVDPSVFPTSLRIEQACESLPAFQKAHADRQPDVPPN